jgi:hypothetical protein
MLTVVLALLLQDSWKIEPKAAVEKVESAWTFRVEGTTSLPAGTVLRIRILALDEVQDPDTGGTMWDEEPLFYGDEAFQDAEVDQGKFSATVYRLARRPYSLRYRARLHYDPSYQNEAVLKAVGDKEWQKDLDFRSGDDTSLSEELKTTAKELHDEFVTVKALFDELKAEFAKPYDAKAWRRWLEGWMDRVQALRDRNEDRLMLWTVWIERQGKLRIEGFCMRLPDLATECREHLEGDKEALERAQTKMKAFLDYYDEAVAVVGLEMPLDLATVEPALESYLKQVETLKKGGSKTEVKRAGLEALLTIAGSFERRKKGYYRVNQIVTRFTELLHAPDSKAFQKALEEHDREVREFKAYAGIR